MKRLLAAAVTALAVSVMIPSGVAQAAAPSGTAGVRSVVLASEENGVWLVNGTGTGLHELAATAGASQSTPSFAPSGRQIAYSQGGEVWVIETTGGSPRQLTHSGGTAGADAWSPDGKWIAFVRSVNGGSDAFRIRPTGGTAARISYGAQHGCIAGAPAWSPDGTSIAYVEGDSSAASCAQDGLVVQKLGKPGVLVVPGTVRGPSFTPTGNLVYRAPCPDVCGDQWVGYESAANGTQRHLVDEEDGCMAGDLCLAGMIGTPAGGRGWIANTQAYDENDPIADATSCFLGAYQKAGVVTQTAPQFCLSGILTNSFDAV